MSKKLATLILLSIITMTVIVRYEVVATSFFVNITGAIKQFYSGQIDSAKEFLDRHFYQADKIDALVKENRDLKAKDEVLQTFAKEVLKLSELKNYPAPPEYRVKTVRAISYAALPDMQKIVIDYDQLEPNGIRGLVYNNQTAGVVVEKIGHKQSKALLNGDAKCSYAVFVGSEKAPGIAMGKSEQEMIVRYIPAWMNIEEGDEVETSGLDGIFYAGVKVGKVIKVHKLNAYTEVTITPYYNSFNPSYFYLVEKTQ